MGSIGASVETAGSEVRVRDARAEELGDVAALLGEVYAAFRDTLPAGAWERYIGEIVDVRSRLGVSDVILAECAGRLIGTIGFFPTRRARRWSAGPKGGHRSAHLRCGPVRAGKELVKHSPTSVCDARASAARRRSGCTPARI